jgi:hypothetical protein
MTRICTSCWCNLNGVAENHRLDDWISSTIEVVIEVVHHWRKRQKTCGSMATVARIFGATPIRDPVICRTSWLHWATTLCCVAGICTHWRLDVWFSRLGILLLSTNVLTICTEHCDDFSQATCVETGVDQALLYVCMVDMPAHFSVGCVMIDDHCL